MHFDMLRSKVWVWYKSKNNNIYTKNIWKVAKMNKFIGRKKKTF